MVYVDQLIEWGRIKGGGSATYWCHLLGDTEEELHQMAKSIGLKRSWFQPSPPHNWFHYDLTPSRRNKALENGAVDISDWEPKESLELLRRLKK